MIKGNRIFYAAGPGDVITTYRYWSTGQDDPAQMAVTYSGQFYEICRELDLKALVISSYPQKEVLCHERFQIEHRPFPAWSRKGLAFHLASLLYGVGLVFSILRFRARFAVIADGTTHWFVLSGLMLFGIEIIPSLHCTLWRQYQPRKRLERLIWRLNRPLFCRCRAILAVSHTIAEQVAELTSKRHAPIQEFLPVYRGDEFRTIGPPDLESASFQVLFAGRIEVNKGVFDLVAIAQILSDQGIQDIVFHLCGEGSALATLRQQVQEQKLSHLIICHGHCYKPQMHERLAAAHVLIVPTRTDFVEGFNKVVVEGVLSGRPVVTSAVCPALNYVSDAVVAVPPDQPEAYAAALQRLRQDREFHRTKQQGCTTSRDQFFDLQQGWGYQLKNILLGED